MTLKDLLQNKLVVLTTEWLPKLEGQGYVSFTLLVQTSCTGTYASLTQMWLLPAGSWL